jgi:hypothetical protein
MTFREAPFVTGPAPKLWGAARKEIQKVQRWGIAATADQAAKPRGNSKQEIPATRDIDFLSMY